MTHAHTRAHVYVSQALFSCVDGYDNQLNLFIYSEIKVKTDLFNLDQRQKIKAYFYIEFELEVGVQMSQCMSVNATAFTM